MKVLELPPKKIAELVALGDLPEEALLRTECRATRLEEQPVLSSVALLGDTSSEGALRRVILSVGAPDEGKTSLLHEHGLRWARASWGARATRALPIILELRRYTAERERLLSLVQQFRGRSGRTTST